MSLLGSIFGGGSSTTTTDKTQNVLFEKSDKLPDRPQHKAIISTKKRTTESQENEPKSEASSIVHDDMINPKKKKRKKARTAEKSDGEDGGAASTSPSNNDGGGDCNDHENDKDDKSAEDRTIFVGGLPLVTTTRKSLAALFKDCGPIESTRIRSVPVTGIKLPQSQAGNQNLVKKVCVNLQQYDHDSAKSTVHGYVVFRNQDSVEKALLKNNTRVGEDDGRTITLRVDRSTPSIDPSRSVFCGGLPYGADESSLQDHFVRGCALDVDDIVNVRIVRDKETHRCKGFGYVLFKDKSMVATALNLHESTYMNKPLRVLVCGKRFKGRKGAPRDNDNKATPVLSSSSIKREGASSSSGAAVPGTAAANEEKVTIGAFRRIIAKQTKDAAEINKRKRGGKKAGQAPNIRSGGNTSGLSRRAALDKKVDKKVKKLQKRISKGMGKTRKASK